MEHQMRSLTSLSVLILSFLFPTLSHAQTPSLDGPQHTFQDKFLSNLAGSWKMSGTIRGQSVTHNVDAQWVLNHQFLQVHEEAVTAPNSGGTSYEAIIMIGYDNASERYVAHWSDIFGGRFSETLGYGTKSGDHIEFVFEYPDGPFRTTFRWLQDKKQWQWLMRTKNAAGQWTDFSNLTLTRRAL
jgi:hypothetical protein